MLKNRELFFMTLTATYSGTTKLTFSKLLLFSVPDYSHDSNHLGFKFQITPFYIQLPHQTDQLPHQTEPEFYYLFTCHKSTSVCVQSLRNFDTTQKKIIDSWLSHLDHLRNLLKSAHINRILHIFLRKISYILFFNFYKKFSFVLQPLTRTHKIKLKEIEKSA